MIAGVKRPALRAMAIVSLAVLAAPANAAPPSGDTAPFPEVSKYCTNIAAAAADARFSWQTTKLTELEARVSDKIKALDAKTAEVRGWIEKREAIEKQANEKLVGIYSKMRPETAAIQLSALDDDMAAAVLAQLGSRQASAIFNEIVPERAARLASMIAATPSVSEKKL
jgi:Uncharacterized conserved protein